MLRTIIRTIVVLALLELGAGQAWALNIVAIGSGNFTTAGTWAAGDTTGSLVTTSTASTALTTGNLDSAVFAPGIITVQGFLVRLANRATGSPTNTMTITLRNSTGAVDVQACTINVSDLPPTNTTDDQGGWIFCHFNSNAVLLAATNYVIRATLSATSTAVSLSTNGTANNWQHVVVTSTTGAPAAGDNMWINRWYDNGANPATVGGTVTVTMDSTAATDYGTSTASQYRDAAIHISKGGILAYGTAGSTNYILRLSGPIVVYSDAKFTMGSSGAEIPRTSTAVLEFDCPSDGAYGTFTFNGGETDMYGLSRTSGKDVVYALLNTDEAAAQTTLGVDTDTGWLSGDEVGIAPTSRTYTQAEARTLNADAGASSIVVTAGLTNAHGGTAPISAEVVLLTRNVQMRSVTSTNATFNFISGTAIFRASWTLFRYASSNNTSRRTINFATTTGTLTVDRCAFRDGENITFLTEQATDTVLSAIAFTNNVFYSIGTGAANSGHGYAFHFSNPQTLAGWTISGNVVAYAPGNTAFGAGEVIISDLSGTFTNNRFAGSSNNAMSCCSSSAPIGTFSGNVFHSNNDTNLTLTANGTITNLKTWHSNGQGFTYATPGLRPLIIDDALIFGNANGIVAANNALYLTLKNVTVAGDTSFAQSCGITWNAAQNSTDTRLRIEKSTFGNATGIYVTHTTADICQLASTASRFSGIASQATFGSATLFSNVSTASMNGSFLAVDKWANTANSHRIITPYGTIFYEVSTVDVSPSIKLTPTSATIKLESNGGRSGRGLMAPVLNGNTITATVKVQKDGSYNGNAPRLIVKANPAIGLDTDTVLDTLTVGSGTWETLTGTTGAATDNGVFEFVVDGDGTAGSFFADTWTVDGGAIGDSKWLEGLPILAGPDVGGGAGGGEHSYPFLK